MQTKRTSGRRVTSATLLAGAERTGLRRRGSEVHDIEPRLDGGVGNPVTPTRIAPIRIAGAPLRSGTMTDRPEIGRLSLEKKVRLCSGRDMWSLEEVDELGLRSVVVTDGPHGLRRNGPDITGMIEGAPATCFPTASGLAASWDPALVRAVGAAIGREAVAQEVAVVLGPGANIKRHPLCGRNFEYFSEDPFLTGEMAAAMIDGIQSVGVGSSLKHFAVNNQETMRMVVDAIVDERSLREIYLAGFERAVISSRPTTVMCAYNKVNGTYASEHRWLLTEVLRDEWGFDGLVMTDWGATNDRVDGLDAGLDLEMPGSAGIHDEALRDAVRKGRLDETTLDRSVERVIEVIARGNELSAVAGECDLDEHHRLARRAAAETVVLLTNDGVLPLDRDHTVAVIGGFATAPRYQGAGSSMVTPTRLDTALDSFESIVSEPGRVTFAQGYDPLSDDVRPDLIDAAADAARDAAEAVVIVGLPPSYESEAYDRDHLRLPRQHDDLVRAVCRANPRTVVVLCNGAPVEMPWVEEPAAILEAYLGGQGGGAGMVDVLYGRVSPGGRLAETFPVRQRDVGSDPWFPGTGRQVQYREGIHVGYRWFDAADVEVLFPFGHGLGYTDFEYSPLEITAQPMADGVAGALSDLAVTAGLRITNVGDRAGSEVVQLYVRPLNASVQRPERELRGFEKVFLEPGQSRAVEFRLDRRAFCFYDVDSGGWRVDAPDYELLVGSSSRDIRRIASCGVASDATVVDPAVAMDPRGVSPELIADQARFESMLGHRVPPADPVRPFNRNSTLGEVSDTWPGALLGRVAARMVRSRLGAEIDDGLTMVIERAMTEAPLRLLAASSEGRIGFRALDRFIALLNRWPARRGSRRGD